MGKLELLSWSIWADLNVKLFSSVGEVSET